MQRAVLAYTDCLEFDARPDPIDEVAAPGGAATYDVGAAISSPGRG